MEFESKLKGPFWVEISSNGCDAIPLPINVSCANPCEVILPFLDLCRPCFENIVRPLVAHLH